MSNLCPRQRPYAGGARRLSYQAQHNQRLARRLYGPVLYSSQCRSCDTGSDLRRKVERLEEYRCEQERRRRRKEEKRGDNQ